MTTRPTTTTLTTMMDLDMLFQPMPNGAYSPFPNTPGQDSRLWDEGKKVVDEPSWPFGKSSPPESPVDPLSNIWEDLQNPIINNTSTGDFNTIEDLTNWLETPIDFQNLFNNLSSDSQDVQPPLDDAPMEQSNHNSMVEEDWLQTFSPVSVEELESILSSEPGSPAETTDYTNNSTINLLDFVDPPVEVEENKDTVDSLFSLHHSLPENEPITVKPVENVGDSNYVDVELSETNSVVEHIDNVDVYDGLAESTRPGRRKRSEKPVAPLEETPVKSGRVTKKSRTLEKKLRKMQQNKDAATRYRIKKKEEKLGKKSELEELEDHNTALKQKVESLSSEIKYLKDLMSEVYRAKVKTKKK